MSSWRSSENSLPYHHHDNQHHHHHGNDDHDSSLDNNTSMHSREHDNNNASTSNNNNNNNNDHDDRDNINHIITGTTQTSQENHHHRHHHSNHTVQTGCYPPLLKTPINQINENESRRSCQRGNHSNHGHQGSASLPPPLPSVTSHNTSMTPSYSFKRVAVILPLITTLSSAGWAIGRLIEQYLLSEMGWHDRGMSSTFGGGGSGNDSAAAAGGGLCGRNESDPNLAEDNRIQAEVSSSMMFYSLATCLPAFLSCLVAGALVDIVGRKPPLIQALMCTSGQLVLAMFIMGFRLNPHIFYLAYALDGLGGSYFAFLIASFSVTADVSSSQNSRVLGIAIITVLGSLAYSILNVIIGILIKNVGFIAAAWAILIPLVLSVIIAIFFLPETLPVPKQSPTLRRVWDYTKRTVHLYTRDGDARTRKCLFILLAIFFATIMNFVNTSTTDTLYQKHAPLCWNAAQLGYYAAFRHAGTYTAALAYLCVCRRMRCISDERLAMVGMIFLAGSYTLEAFVTTTWQMFLVPVIMIPGVNIAHITRGVMSVLAGPEKQGVMFSSVALIEVACSLTACMAYNKIYAVTVDYMPGFVYLVMACVSLLTFGLFVPFFHYYDKTPRAYRRLQNGDVASSDGSHTSSTTSSDCEQD